MFGGHDYDDVSTENNVYVTQCATDEYTEFLFKNKHVNSTDGFTTTWKGKTDLAPSDSTVYLQVFNRISGLWETKDSDNTTAANTDFTLTGTVDAGVSDYYDAGNWVAWRVYQEVT